MSNDQLHHLIKMVNQISDNNRYHDSPEAAAEAVATHLQKFWARSMKQMIIDYAQQDGSELNEMSRAAVARLERPADAA
ncbi:formate dehydrogenase subunit delta [Marinobacter sp. C2H3]|uniref:formate dehydrogenase subunit delta n=1 Tax=Marinobacter sp. C2H3 TaxID=3119003 RepID=UPI00300F1FF4